MKIPKTENAVKLIRNNQSIVMFCKSPEKPIKEFIVITNSEVAMAFLIVSRANLVSAGTIKKPPPAPIKPIKTPTKNNWIMVPYL